MSGAGALTSLALLRVHVLVIGMPRRPALRLRAEAAVRARSWVVTAEPADADVLLVCGAPDAELADAVDALWWRVPAPRARRMVGAEDELPEALDSAARVLADAELQRRAAQPGTAPEPEPDGRFGPLGAAWPPGLIVECTAGTDGRITAVGIRRLGAGSIGAGSIGAGSIGAEAADAVPPGVLAVADAARLLRFARWEAPAQRLDRVVDLLLAGTPPERVRVRLRRVAALVDRSASFRWSAAGDEPAVDLRERVLALLTSVIDGTEPPAPARRLIGARVADVPAIVATGEHARG